MNVNQKGYVTLTKDNYHRAKTVRRADDETEYEFTWQAIRTSTGIFSDVFTHHATANGKPLIEITDSSLGEWQVTSWKYEENFEDLKLIARDAFLATSHSPEERGRQYIRESEAVLQENLKQITDARERSDYIAKFRSHVLKLFILHGRIMSSMIVGPARFPKAKNDKANAAYDDAISAFQKWRENYAARLAKRIEAAKPEEQRTNEEWERVKERIMDCAAGWRISTNLYNRLETIARNGKTEIIKRSMELVKELNAKNKANGRKEIFTSRHKFWKLLELCEHNKAKEAERAGKEDAEVEINGVTVVKCFSEDRLQLFYDGKPDDDTIRKLKGEAWRWSPRNGCWQRQLTYNATWSAARILAIADTMEECKEIRAKIEKA